MKTGLMKRASVSAGSAYDLDDRAGRIADGGAFAHAAPGWHRAKAGARAFASAGDPARMLADGLWVADALIVLVSALIAYVLRHGLAPIPLEVFSTILLALVLTLNVMHFSGAYTSALEEGLLAQIGRSVRAWSAAFTVLIVIAYLTRTSEDYSRLWVAGWYGLALAGFAMLRAWSISQTRRWKRQGRLARTVAIVELGGGGKELLARLQSSDPGQLHLVGLFSGDLAAANPAAEPKSGIRELFALSRLFRIDEVLVVASGDGAAALPGVLRKLGTIPTNVRVCPWVAELGTPVRDIGWFLHSPVLTIHRKPLNGWNRVIKRLEDVVLAAVLMVLLAPLLLLIALAIKLDSPGPVLFRQQRLGFNNNTIVVFKFRSMKHCTGPEEEVPQAQRRDPRVTRLGRVLRRLSLDELPQLFNVLMGDMSLVGPRPHALAHNDQYSALIDDYLGRHRVQPGITGLAQVKGFRGETDTLDKMQRRVEFDLAYIDNWSILMDLRIMLMTGVSLVFHRDVY